MGAELDLPSPLLPSHSFSSFLGRICYFFLLVTFIQAVPIYLSPQKILFFFLSNFLIILLKKKKKKDLRSTISSPAHPSLSAGKDTPELLTVPPLVMKPISHPQENFPHPEPRAQRRACSQQRRGSEPSVHAETHLPLTTQYFLVPFSFVSSRNGSLSQTGEICLRLCPGTKGCFIHLKLGYREEVGKFFMMRRTSF